eukprot:TCALIF_12864-PA protein Name:"Similar to Max Protein max (Mus musculus)" AED:0.22 eAED:0.22 QI:0/-1/0/1/-1/1/1/0/223
MSSHRSRPFVDKRAHHNALERKRRDHIKESFCGLRDAIPTMHGDKSSRAQILKKASEYISFMREKNSVHQQEIDSLKKINTHMEEQIRALESAKTSGIYSSPADVLEAAGLNFEIPPEVATSMEELSSAAAAVAATAAPATSSNYEGGSGSDTSDGSGTIYHRSSAPAAQGIPQQVQRATVVTTATQGGGIRSIQPGQSLLIAPAGHHVASSNGEPVLKRMRP